MSDEVLYRAPRGDSEELRVTRGEYQGKPTLQIRVWFRGNDGQFRPTQKGVSIRRGELDDIISTLIDVRDGRAYPNDNAPAAEDLGDFLK